MTYNLDMQTPRLIDISLNPPIAAIEAASEDTGLDHGRSGGVAAPVASDSVQLGFNALDTAAILELPADLMDVAKRTATDLAKEGARGPAARRLLARDVAISQARLRLLQGMASMAVTKGDLRQARDLDRLIAGEHARLLAALDQLGRIDPAPASIQISATTANVQVNPR